MTPNEIIQRLISLHDRILDSKPIKQIDLDTLLEAASLIMEQCDKVPTWHPSQQTSNGDTVATFFNNVVKIQKGEVD